MRKEEEISRAMKGFKAAVEFADKLDQGASANYHNGNASNRERSSNGNDQSKRTPRPHVPFRASIDQYSRSELILLLRWIASDGQLRTNDQMMDEMVAALGFSRRGVRIERTIQSAIESWRPTT